MAGRYWGYWTKGKLDLLARYLDRFTTATKRSPACVYLDPFAGQPQNLDRLTLEEIRGSARVAIETDNPPFARLDLFELEDRAAALDTELRARYPDAPFVVHPGDCNSTIRGVLADITAADLAWAPTFAFIDPDGPDCHWSTLEALAGHKPARLRTKVEMWMLFPAGLSTRMLPTTGNVPPAHADQLTRMYGTEQWRAIYEARLAGTIEPSDAREEYVNLMRWRIEKVLGYQWTMALEVHNEGGTSLYHMIFATDSEPGFKIMTSLYSRALVEHPAMRRHAIATRLRLAKEAEGQFTLFDALGIEDPPPAPTDQRIQYQHAPPWEPPGSA